MRRTSLFLVGILWISSLSLGTGIENPSMESDFYDGVAEFWTGWGGGWGAFYENNFYDHVHEGVKSQLIQWNSDGWSSGSGFGPKGIFQPVTLPEVGRMYRVSVWSNYVFQHDGMWGQCDITCSVGVEPDGGSNPAVVTNWRGVSYSGSGWYEGPWQEAVTFFTSSGPAATVFIQVTGSGYAEAGGDPMMPPFSVPWTANAFIDDVSIELIEIGSGSGVEATSPVPANGINYSTVKITVLNSAGEPISGIPVSEIVVNCTGSGNTITGPTAATDANGRTTLTIKSTVAESKTVSVTVLGNVLADTAVIEFGDTYAGPIWYVDASNTGYRNGSSDHPFVTISDAVLPSQNGDTIIVSPGTYNENVNNFGKELTIRSTDPEDWDVVRATIIDGTGSGSAITISGFVDRDFVFSGFTVSGGNGNYYGGGIYCPDSYASPVISHNRITGNSGSYGGGIYGGRATLMNNIIENNTAEYGGGIYGCYGKITYCLIINNSSSYSFGYGGGLYSCGGDISNCTIAGNSSPYYGGGLYSCNGTIKNCIIWGNAAGTGAQLHNCSVPTYSCVQDWAGTGTGNISGNPLFADAAGGDYHLQSSAGRWAPLTGVWVMDSATSPCIDGGDPANAIGVELNPNGGRINMGYYGGTMEASKSTSGIVQPVCLAPLSMDANGDCKVNLADFAEFARQWLGCNLDPVSVCWE